MVGNDKQRKFDIVLSIYKETQIQFSAQKYPRKHFCMRYRMVALINTRDSKLLVSVD